MNDNKSKALAAALAQIEKQFGKGSIMKMGEGSVVTDIPVVSTGSLGLDIALGIGGLPRGRVVEIYGPESSGKTTLTLQVIAEMQKLGGTAAFIDAEHALDPGYAQKLGVNLDELLISQPDTGEQALEIADMLVRSSAVDIVVIDSVAASAATLVALGCGSVRMHEDSLFMIHEAASLAMGTADDLDQQAALLRQINDILAGAYERKTKAGKEQIAKWMAEETWFPAAQAKELGFADEVIPGRSKASAAAFGRFFAHYKRVPEALRIAAQPAAQVPTPAINALAKPSAANTPKRPPMDRKTLIATMAGCLALAQETAQAMADSSDSELSEAGRTCLADGALPACSKALQPLAQKDGAEPTNLSEALRVVGSALQSSRYWED